MTAAQFANDRELVEFAKSFLRDRVSSFRKDIAICLTRDKSGHHAYFPALITCIAFVDLLTGLFVGQLDNHGLSQLQRYAAQFMNSSTYDPLRLAILYEAFRHKLAHLAYPYIIFDTTTKPTSFGTGKQRRITWKVYASKRKPSIELIDYPSSQSKLKTETPWPVSYDSRILISVSSFAVDIVASIYGPSGYLHSLRSDPALRRNFVKCMKQYFPP